MLPALGEAVFGGRALGDGNKTSKEAKLGTADRGAGWDLAARETPRLQLSKRLWASQSAPLHLRFLPCFASPTCLDIPLLEDVLCHSLCS